MINENNWYYEYYSFQEVQSKIFLGMNNANEEYYVVSFLKKDLPVKEKKFLDFNQACQFINNECRSWTFSGVTLEGCSTCKAH